MHTHVLLWNIPKRRLQKAVDFARERAPLLREPEAERYSYVRGALPTIHLLPRCYAMLCACAVRLGRLQFRPGLSVA